MNGQSPGNEGWTAGLVLGAVAALFNLPAMVLTLPLIALARWRPVAIWVLALAGTGVTALLWSRIVGEMEAALEAMRRAGGFWEDPERALQAAWPHVRAWWLMTIGLAPSAAAIIDLLRPRTVEELRDFEERRSERLRNPARTQSTQGSRRTQAASGGQPGSRSAATSRATGCCRPAAK